MPAEQPQRLHKHLCAAEDNFLYIFKIILQNYTTAIRRGPRQPP
jgi:hypothetical protein